MALKKVGIAVVATAAAGALAVGGAAIANAATVPGTATVASTAAADDTAPQTPDPQNSDAQSPGAQNSDAQTPGQGDGPGAADPQHADDQHTPVTGDELAKVTAAVTAKDSSVTVVSVRKDPDGSYDVFGTKSGNRVMFEVSADLQTVTERTGPAGGPGGKGPGGVGPGGGSSQDTPVTGDELTKVTAAVTAKDSSVTVVSVRKDPDGSYDVFGTKSGNRVMLEVSADLQTITENTGPGGHR